MDQTTRSALPSKSEVAFRFVACTGIALALYYTPELKWSSNASDPATVQADVFLKAPTPNASLEACAARETPDILADAAMKAN